MELPYDILLLIIGGCDLPTLASWARTSKAYHNDAEKRLYRSIHSRILTHAYATQRPITAYGPTAIRIHAAPRWAEHVQHLIIGVESLRDARQTLLRDAMQFLTSLQCITLPLGDSLDSLRPAELDEIRRLFGNFQGRFVPAWDLEIRQDRPAVSPFPPGWSLATLTRSRPPQEVQLSLLFGGERAQPLEPHRYLETVLGRQPKLERLLITTVEDDLCSHGQVGNDTHCMAYAAGLYGIVAPLATAVSQPSPGQECLRRRFFPALREVAIRVPQGAKGRYWKGPGRERGSSTFVWRPSRTSIYAAIQVHFHELIAQCEAAASDGEDFSIEVHLVPSGEGVQ